MRGLLCLLTALSKFIAFQPVNAHRILSDLAVVDRNNDAAHPIPQVPHGSRSSVGLRGLKISKGRSLVSRMSGPRKYLLELFGTSIASGSHIWAS